MQMQTATKNDFRFAVPDNITISLPSKNPEGSFFVNLEGGISVRLYIRLMRFLTEQGDVDALKDLAYSIVREDPTHKDMTPDCFSENFDQLRLLRKMVEKVLEAASEILSDPELAKPIVEVKQESQKVVLPKTGKVDIMQDIAFLCSKTAHTYNDIMCMPYVVFISLLKNITHLEALKDPEYLEQYVNQQKQMDVITNKQKYKKLDLKGLKRLQTSL